MALNIRYVRPDAAGGGDGTTNTNSGANGAWTIEESVTNHAAGMEIRFINSGTFTDAASRAYSVDGTGDAPIIFTGRSADDSAYENSFIQKNGNYHTNFNGDNYVIKFLDITSSRLSATTQMNGAKSVMHNCKIRNSSTNGTNPCNALSLSSGNVYNCYLQSLNANSTSGTKGTIDIVSGRVILFGNKVVTKGWGVRVRTTTCAYDMQNNLIIGDGAGIGVVQTGYYSLHLFKNNTIYNLKNGFSLPADIGSDTATFIINNLFHTCTSPDPSDPGYAIDLGLTGGQNDWLINAMGNRYYNCDEFIIEDKYNLNNIELTTDPFVSGSDFELNNTAGGGASCKNISSPAYTWTWNH